MVNQEQVLEILHAVGEKITEEKLFLTELDNVIGDGDHGINLARGFAEIEKKRPMMEGKDIGTMLKTAGMALVSTVGGASGPLYGTAFMQAGKALAGKTELDAQDLVTILDAFVAGVQLRGKSVAGEKTMANGVVELTKMMADGVPIRAAGGLEDGGFGTSYEKIANAIEEIYSDDGVIVLMDMGSAVMTAEMVLEAMPERKLILADCPLVEGAVAATVSAIAGSSLEEIMDELPDVRELKKLS